MAEPVISLSDPADDATDVYVNTSLSVTFTAAILEASVTTTTVLLEDVGANQLTSIDVELATTTQIRITPIGTLAEDTLYRIKFPGTDTALSSSYVIKGDDSTALTTTLTVTFKTGSRTYIDDTAIDKNATDLSLEGDLNLPIHVKALGDLALETVAPKNHAYDVDLDTTVVFTFNNHLSSGDFSEDWLDIDLFPILDSTDFLSTSDTLGTGNIPGYTVSHSLDTLTVTFATGLPQNLGVQITLDDLITDDDGSEFGPNTYKYSITTDRYPSISGIHAIHRELQAISDELTNDYIASTLLSSAIRFIYKHSAVSETNHLALRWVVARSIIDILDDKELEKAVVAGTRRQLGDMNVSVDPIIGKLALKHKRAEDELDKIDKTLIKGTAKSYSLEGQGGIIRPAKAWLGVNHKLVESRFVYWQPNIPASNLVANRNAKVPPSQYFY